VPRIVAGIRSLNRNVHWPTVGSDEHHMQDIDSSEQV
jgi:hypothetical protein